MRWACRRTGKFVIVCHEWFPCHGDEDGCGLVEDADE